MPALLSEIINCKDVPDLLKIFTTLVQNFTNLKPKSAQAGLKTQFADKAND